MLQEDCLLPAQLPRDTGTTAGAVPPCPAHGSESSVLHWSQGLKEAFDLSLPSCSDEPVVDLLHLGAGSCSGIAQASQMRRESCQLSLQKQFHARLRGTLGQSW